MPWPMYPMILKTTTSHEEGCTRKWAINAKEFIKDEAGKSKRFKSRRNRVEQKDPVTKRYTTFAEKPGTEFTIECDLAFLAMGFLHVEQKEL